MSPATVSKRTVKEYDTEMTNAHAWRAARDTKMKYARAGRAERDTKMKNAHAACGKIILSVHEK